MKLPHFATPLKLVKLAKIEFIYIYVTSLSGNHRPRFITMLPGHF